MARSVIPDPLRRRHLVEGKLDPARALAIAEAYLEEDRGVEAVDFLRKAGAGEKLDALRRRAVEAGDAFLLRAVARAQARAPSRDEWLALARAAAAAGKTRYAEEATRQADRGEA